MNKKEIKERAKKIFNWKEIEFEILEESKDYGRILNAPKEYKLETVDDIKIIQEVEKLQAEKWKITTPSILYYKKIFDEYFKGEENAKNGKKSRTIQKNCCKNQKNKC